MPPSAASLARIRRSLLAWYAVEHRDLPWRHTRDPYAVLVSEVMLQQTQASRVIDRYERFMQRFPTLEALAAAPPSAVLAEWNGLGYNRRALALRRAAIAVARDGWPRDVAGLQRLPGVGPYTARAIASLAFGVRTGVVDTNVRRWLLRRFGATDRPQELQALADRMARTGGDPDASAAFTHATMEFGARVCTARSPRCDACPLARGCPSRGRAAAVPVARQPAFSGSDRARRGALVRALSSADGHALRPAVARAAIGAALDASDFDRLVAGLERDGLVHRSGGLLRLGHG
jgi:A/G-specific adenine glycosylase